MLSSVSADSRLISNEKEKMKEKKLWVFVAPRVSPDIC